MAAVRLFAEVFGGAAEWAERLQQPDLMATFLRRGLEAVSAKDGPDSALCWGRDAALATLGR